MHTIHYTNARFETDGAVAEAVLDYAERLALAGSCATVRIPSISHGLPSVSYLLIGAGLPIAVETDPRDDARDNYGVTVDPFDVHRALHEIGERTRLLSAGATAQPPTADEVVDDAWKLSFDGIASLREMDDGR